MYYKSKLKNLELFFRLWLLIFAFFAIVSKALSQENYPFEISVQVHKGVETFSLKQGEITVIENDSIAYLYNSRLDKYVGNNEYVTSKIFKRDTNTFVEENINSDSSLILFNEREIPVETIRGLIKNLNQYIYEDQELVEEYVFGKSETIEIRDTILIPSELKKIIKISIEKNKASDKLSQFKDHRKLEKPKNNDADKIISILKEAHGIPTVSSYLIMVSIYLRWEHKELRIFQKYPGGNNIKWNIIDGDKAILSLYNHRLNCLINELIPIRLRENIKLLSFDEELKTEKK